jgi:hypothetical protein
LGNGFVAVALNDDKWEVIDKTGKEITPLKYDEVYDFRDGFAMVRLNDKWGFIDTTGNVIIPLKYDFAYSSAKALPALNWMINGGLLIKMGKKLRL